MRKHANQLSGYVWQDLGHNTWRLTFRLVVLEVFWCGDAKAFKYEIHGYRKLRSKDSFASIDVAKSEALKKLGRLVQGEANKVQATIDEFIPF